MEYYSQKIEKTREIELEAQWIKNQHCRVCFMCRRGEFVPFARIRSKDGKEYETFYICPEGMLVRDSQDFWLYTGRAERACCMLPILRIAKELAKRYSIELIILDSDTIDANRL